LLAAKDKPRELDEVIDCRDFVLSGGFFSLVGLVDSGVDVLNVNDVHDSVVDGDSQLCRQLEKAANLIGGVVHLGSGETEFELRIWLNIEDNLWEDRCDLWSR
jgi:hypothetical protein